MKILYTVEFYTPSVGGTQEVVRQIAERLAARGHAVTVATSTHPARSLHDINGVHVVDFAITGNAVRGMTGEVERYREFLLAADFDVVTNIGCEHWATDLMLPLLSRVRGAKVFVPTGFANLFAPEFHAYYEAMPGRLQQYDMNVFLSDCYRDTEFARRHGVERRMVIPNGAAAEEFLTRPNFNIRQRLGIPSGNFLILHVGSHTRLKGHAEAIEIFARAPLQNATLLIVANPLSRRCTLQCAWSARTFKLAPARKRDHKQLLITSLPRPETVAAYQEADLFLFPSNVECSPIVLFECMASRTPFLTTDVGNAAEIIDWSGAGQLLPTRIDDRGYSHAEIEPSVRLLTEIWRDPQRRQDMATAGFKVWQERFTWDHIATQYEQLYEKLHQARQ